MAFDFAGQYGAETFLDGDVELLPGRLVRVDNPGTTTPATLYTDRTKASSLANPITIDARGNATFFADPGPYDAKLMTNGVAGPAVRITVPVDPEETVTTSELDAAIAGVGGGSFTPTDLIGDTDYQAITVLERPWVIPTDPNWGVTEAATDNSAAIQAAAQAAFDNNVALLFPPNTPGSTFGFKVTNSVDLSAMPGLRVGLLGGASSVRRAEFRRGGHVAIENITNANPVFLTASDQIFEHILFGGEGLRGSSVFNITAEDCIFAAGGDDQAALLDNCWDWIFRDCGFQAKDATKPSVRMRGQLPTGDLTVNYLMYFEDCWFDKNGVRLQQDAVSGQVWSQVVFDRCVTENFVGATSSLLEITGSGGGGVVMTVDKPSFRDCGMYDPISGFAPMLRVLTNTLGTLYIKDLGMENCDSGTGAVNLVQVDTASGAFPSFIGGVIENCGLGRVVTSDGVTDYNSMDGMKRLTDGGMSVVGTGNYDNLSDGRLGSPAFATGRAGQRHYAFGIDTDGRIRWGPPTGATGVGSKYDTSLSRNAAGSLVIDGGFAGITADARFGWKRGRTYGRATLVAGQAVVATTSVTANTDIIVVSQVDGGTPGFVRVATRTPGTSFTINSSNAADTSTVFWFFVEPQ